MATAKKAAAAKRSTAAKKAARTRKATAEEKDKKPLNDPPRVDALADAEHRAPDGVSKPRLASSKKVSKAVKEGEMDVAVEELANQSAHTRRGSRKPSVLRVECRDASDQTLHDVQQLVVLYGGTVKSTSGKYLTVEAPLGSDRDPSAAYDRIVNGLNTDPNVAGVEAK